MAYEVIWTEAVSEDLKRVIDYLKINWHERVAESFVIELYVKVNLISTYPDVGKPSFKNPEVRRILVTKQNTLFYALLFDKIVLLNLFDTRQDPEKSPF